MKLVSILLGFIIGVLLSRILIYIYRKKTQKYHGPDSNIIKQHIYKFNNKFYRFTPQLCIGYN